MESLLDQHGNANKSGRYLASILLLWPGSRCRLSDVMPQTPRSVCAANSCTHTGMFVPTMRKLAFREGPLWKAVRNRQCMRRQSYFRGLTESHMEAESRTMTEAISSSRNTPDPQRISLNRSLATPTETRQRDKSYPLFPLSTINANRNIVIPFRQKRLRTIAPGSGRPIE